MATSPARRARRAADPAVQERKVARLVAYWQERGYTYTAAELVLLRTERGIPLPPARTLGGPDD